MFQTINSDMVKYTKISKDTLENK